MKIRSMILAAIMLQPLHTLANEVPTTAKAIDIAKYTMALHSTDAPTTLTEVAQGKWLAIEAPAAITAVVFDGEYYGRHQHSRDYPFVVPIGLRAKLGTHAIELRSRDRIGRHHIRAIYPPWPEQSITLKETTHVNLSAANLQRVQRETPRIMATFKPRSELPHSYAMQPALRGAATGTRFGSRRIINEQPRKRHTGADYAAAQGTPVLASGAGTVTLAEEHFFAGNSVFIDHGEGLVSMYFHLHTIDVAVGDNVALGQQIGTVGSTGRATGPHLHQGFRFRNRIVDPDQTILLFAPSTTGSH